MSQSEENNNNSTPNLNDEWMIRQCAVYDEEYKDCTTIKARFNQLFIFGKTLDCGQWKRDSVNCYKWFEENDIKAGTELVQSEKDRRKKRLQAHFRNDVWTKRKCPPENWNAPLPEHIQKQYENTYLNVKSKEMKGEIPPSFDPSFKLCSIL